MAEEEDQPQSSFENACKKLRINHNLIMLKLTLFVMYGATSSLVPFLTIHMQSIGLTVEEIACIYLALPLTTFLAPPVTGFLVDKFGHYKPVLFISLLLNAIFHHSLMLIPQMETPGQIPPAYVMRHPQHGKVEVWWSPCPSRECPEKEELNLVVDKCEDHCLLYFPNNSTYFPHKSMVKVEPSIAVRPYTPLRTSNTLPMVGCFGITDVTESPVTNVTTVNPDLHFIVEKRPKNATKQSKTTTPAPRKVRSADYDYRRNGTNMTEDETVFMVLDMHENLMTPVENLGMELPEHDDSSEVTDFRQHFKEDVLVSSGVNFSALLEEDLRCGGRVVATNLTYRKLNELAADCMLQKCSFRTGGPEICPPDYKESDDRIYWLYFCLRFVGTTMMSASVTVMDPIALTLIQQYGGEFGRERLFSTIGMAIFSPLTGILIDYKSRQAGYTDFSYAFYMYDVLLLISILTVLWMPVGPKMPVDNIMTDMLKLLKLPHIIGFIFFMFALGNLWGFIESYLFLHLKELGASNYLLGFTVSVATLSSIPFLYGAEKITHKIGHVNVIVLAFFSHAVRLIGYSCIEEPLWVFPFEAMEAVAVHLMWVAAATYCAVIAPRNLLATLIGVVGMAHFSLGRGSGSFVGGCLIGQFGTRQSFRLMGIGGFITGLIYSLMYFTCLRSYDRKQMLKKSLEQDFTAEIMENGKEAEEKLNAERRENEELAERLSLIIKLNHRGSLTSLDRVQLSRRNSTNADYTSRQSNSQIKIIAIDGNNFLKSNLELSSMYKLSQSSFIYYKTSVPQLHKLCSKEFSDGSIDAILIKKNSHVLSDDIRARSGSIPEEEEWNENENFRSNARADSDESIQRAVSEEK
ncbi:uncharacterized protein LOC135832927 [Planococcus citri]|uniref:uncharacterized protein LOC135832927 n=1 Tax=Planococcus citri TaxID=170843 RepID=UPI0031F80EDF